MNSKNSSLADPLDSRKPLSKLSCPLASLWPGLCPRVSQPRWACKEKESGSCRFICTWIIEQQDFVRTVGHPNCPRALGFRARETRSRRGGSKVTCGAFHTDRVINLDKDAISSTCSLSTSVSRRDTPSFFPRVVFFGAGGGPWWQIQQGQNRFSCTSFLENSMVWIQLEGAWDQEGCLSGAKVRV